MQRVEDEVLALVGARMTGDHLGPAGDHHHMDIAADQYFAVREGGRHRVAHQQLRADPARLLLAGVIGRWRQGVERFQIPNQPFADRFVVDRAGDPRTGADNPRAAAPSSSGIIRSINKMPLCCRLADSARSRGELNPAATVHLHLLGKPSA
jgi:hypothetical protein